MLFASVKHVLKRIDKRHCGNVLQQLCRSIKHNLLPKVDLNILCHYSNRILTDYDMTKKKKPPKNRSDFDNILMKESNEQYAFSCEMLSSLVMILTAM